MSFSPLQEFENLLGAAHVIRDPAQMAPYLEEWRGLYHGRAAAILKPGSVTEISRIMATAHTTKTPIVPQGGNTGLVGGQISTHAQGFVLSLARLNQVRAVDPANNTLSVDAGLTLAEAQNAAAEAGRLFPLSLASEGSCQIGGTLSTNAGGTSVIRYGNARDLVLGLEVVLADGRVWDGMRHLRKDNTGYDLKHLFMGSEGTLGIITGAVLKLFPAPRARAVALVAVPDVRAAITLLRHIEERTGGLINAFELMPRTGIDFVTRHIEGTRNPLPDTAPWYVLTELTSGQSGQALDAVLAAALESGLHQQMVTDAAVAGSNEQIRQLWTLREAFSEAQKREGASIKHDISVPVSAIDSFIAEASAAVCTILPGIRPVPFGHIGDGNVHFNLSQPPDMDGQAFLEKRSVLNDTVHRIAHAFQGSISAEHGIGQLKREALADIKAGVELDMMRAIKNTLDPNGILNPGKVL